MKAPQLVLLAGPNGAGKSTFYDLHLADSPLPFLNADLLAARTGIDSFEAARLLDAERQELILRGLGFITETVFSDPAGVKLGLLRAAIAAGYEVNVIYIGIESPELAGLRVDQRVAAGGHDVPRERLMGRFERSLANLRAALAFVPSVEIYDNSSVSEPFRLIATFTRAKQTFVTKEKIPRWARPLVSARSRKPSRRRPRR